MDTSTKVFITYIYINTQITWKLPSPSFARMRLKRECESERCMECNMK